MTFLLPPDIKGLILLIHSSRNSNTNKKSDLMAEAFVQRCSAKKDVLKNFAKFTGKHLCRSPFLIKSQTSACNFIKKENLVQVFSCEFCKISQNTFFIGHLRTTAFFLLLSTNLECLKICF